MNDKLCSEYLAVFNRCSDPEPIDEEQKRRLGQWAATRILTRYKEMKESLQAITHLQETVELHKQNVAALTTTVESLSAKVREQDAIINNPETLAAIQKALAEPKPTLISSGPSMAV